ncbi:MAG TPA: hypothetical protein VEU96_16570 [Bryobacteraceae bacterium]|nr:hypothetical protein [Bryobacteraceae bacterium]
MSVSSEDLILRRSAGEIHVLAPRLHFLTGKALQRLRDGATVPFDFQFTIAAGSRTNVVQRTVERFMVSYDVWEEKFKVVALGNYRRYGSHLSANAAEAWCLENIFVPSANLPADKQLWARLEVRGVEPKEQASTFTDPGISITTLIEIFSHQPRLQQEHLTLESTPFLLSDLKP